MHDVDADSLENIPVGLDGSLYRWADIDGEGSSGILTEQGGAWWYKRNLSPLPVVAPDGTSRVAARFAPVERLATIPSTANLSGGRTQLLDLAGDGQLDVVEFDGPTPGCYERTHDEDWDPFVAFRTLPNVPWHDPNLKFVDLTGDGHADILITEDEALTWYPSLAEAGFASAERVRQALDEEKGPSLVFADGTQSIYLSDVSGDGLTDLVRIRNGEVCYWPSLGYGRFGAKVTMDHAPWFDAPDQFDRRRIRLGDIDGSGTTDILYLGRDGVEIYRNQAGNGWGASEPLKTFPKLDDLSSVMAVDLLGNGTACLVWSSALPTDTGRPMRYVDLMGGKKPHLLTRVVNNLGAETHVHYAPSTKFYLADKLAGNRWVTKLPFPVHVVERVETYDRISRNRFVTRYAYHHGYFDGEEREFRGFGMVEQWDTEEYATLSMSPDFPTGDNVTEASHVPPALTKTWFHTGAFLCGERISRQFEREYYREPGLTDQKFLTQLLPDTTLLPGLSIEETREACRALRGSVLRQEVYAVDGTPNAHHPYGVSERDYSVKLLQPRSRNRYAVFYAHPRETIDYHYERNPGDPRIQHALTLDIDDFGNVLREAAIGYGRRQPDPTLEARDQAKQSQTLVTYTENGFTNTVHADDAYRTPVPCETRTYELLRTTPDAAERAVTNRFTLEEVLAKIEAASDGLHDIPYEDVEAASAVDAHPYRRLIEHARTLYRRDDLGGPLPLGQLESLALPFASHQLALTPGLVAVAYGGRVTDAMLEDDGKYVHSEGDVDWWIPSGQVFYSPNAADGAATELAYARQHFFLPHRYRDPFHRPGFNTETMVSYDLHDLLIQETVDALDNRVTAGERSAAGGPTQPGNDYRVLLPRLVTDPNRNRAAVAFDALGMVAGTAVMGKPEENLGDSLSGFDPDLDDATIQAHVDDPLGNQPVVDPHAILLKAGTRLISDLWAYYRTRDNADPEPGVVYAMARETHDADLQAGQKTKIQHSFAYSDGFGREIQQKVGAEPGLLDLSDASAPVVDPRWVGSGWKVYNNKGDPVRQYEPFFSDTHRFEFAKTVGVSPVLFYDAVGRAVGTLHPNHTYEKIVFDPWQQATWDVNDTVLQADPKDDPDIGDFFRRLPAADYLPTWHDQRQSGALGTHEQVAATKSAVHAETPMVAYFDTLGRPFLTPEHNRFERNGATVDEEYMTRVGLDIEGNQRTVVDAEDRVVMRYDYDLLGNVVHQASMEAGQRWMLNDVAGNPICAWDSRNHQFHSVYDELRRPLETWLTDGGAPKVLVERTVYGETRANPETGDLRGQVVESFDQAGKVTSDEYDFKGNLLKSARQLAVKYKTTLDWSAAVPLEQPAYGSRMWHDALNRPTQLVAPHSDRPGSLVNVIQHSYNEANLTERIDAWLNQTSEPTGLLDPTMANIHAVTNIDYDAKGQRVRIDYGNGATTTYAYDPLTFRLIHLKTTRPANPDATASLLFRDATVVQDLRYTYDPAGNITRIEDHALKTVFHHGQRVDPVCAYIYDAIYRLIEARGREHIGQTAHDFNPPGGNYRDYPFVGLREHPNDSQALRNYTERYEYDAVGNFEALRHLASGGSWKRRYDYEEDSLLEAGKQSNRLTRTTVGNGFNHIEAYTHDAHGNMTAMPHLATMVWDFEDQLQQVDLGGGGTAYYVYDVAGQRVRKVIERETGARRKERIYLDGFEICREYSSNGATVTVERESLHVMDDEQRIALVETLTTENGNLVNAPGPLQRYQFGNHLGSTWLELDQRAQIISYQEYYSYGSTAYQAVRHQTETATRYRYISKEQDEESAFYYHGARYYAPWLGKWVTVDPAGMVDGLNLYAYVRDNPLTYVDRTGKRLAESTEPPVLSRLGTPGLSCETCRLYGRYWGGVAKIITYPIRHPIKTALAVKSSIESATDVIAMATINLVGSERQKQHVYDDVDQRIRSAIHSAERLVLSDDPGDVVESFGKVVGGVGLPLLMKKGFKYATPIVVARIKNLGGRLRKRRAAAKSAPSQTTGSTPQGAPSQPTSLPRPSDTSILQHHAIEANANLALDSSLAGRLPLLSPRGLAAARRGSMVPARYGQALENLVDLQLRLNPKTRQMFLRLGGPSKPDWIPNTPARLGYNFFTSKNFDLFTLNPRATRRHLGRSYGASMEPIYYVRPPNFKFQ